MLTLLTLKACCLLAHLSSALKLQSSAVLKKKKKEALAAVICSVDLLKGTTAALQHVGGILQTASSVKLEMSAMEVFGVLQSVTHVYANF